MRLMPRTVLLLNFRNMSCRLLFRHTPCRVGLGFVAGALGRLHRGELEAIILAKELAADYVVLDDLLTRRKAQQLGLQVIGTVGLLLWMEKKQLLDAGQTWQKLQLLTGRHGLYLSPLLQEQIKQKLFGGH